MKKLDPTELPTGPLYDLTLEMKCIRSLFYSYQQVLDDVAIYLEALLQHLESHKLADGTIYRGAVNLLHTVREEQKHRKAIDAIFLSAEAANASGASGGQGQGRERGTH